MERLLLFSADCHAGPMPEQYAPYLEQQFQDDLAQYVLKSRNRAEERAEAMRQSQTKVESAEDGLSSATYVDVAAIDVRTMFATNLEKRLPALENDGFVGEVLFPDGSVDNEIPFSGLFGGPGSYSPEQHHAALRGYNRWLGEHCEPGRQIGAALVPLDDPVYAAAEVKHARELGLGGIYPEWDPSDSDAPPLYDEAYDPFWAACVDNNLPVCIHSGAGVPSGLYERPSKQGGLLFVFEVQFWARRPIWHLIFGGVLERHPKLRVCWVETWGDWLPRFVESMDWQWEVWDARLPGGVKEFSALKPSEYWERQCAIAIATPSVGELERRNEFPISTMMYGTDFPHAGSPWGVSNEYLQQTVGKTGCSEEEARAFLGENVIRWFDLDRSQLAKIADRIGPFPGDILEPTPGSLEKMNPYMQSKVRRPPSV